jgi:CGNR zinc finger
MSQVIPVNLPIRFQSLRVPAKWRIERFDKTKDEDHMFSAALTYSPVSSYDAWEKRNEFFRLKEGDNEGLLNFLNSIGVWDRPNQDDAGDFGEDDPHEFTQEGGDFLVQGQPLRFSDDFWHIREHAQIALSSKKGLDILSAFDLPVRLVLKSTGSYFLICTITFLETLLATVLIDNAKGARVLKCARPDCGIVFSTDNQHERKYCSWDCGHLVAVRKFRLTKQQNPSPEFKKRRP